MNARAQCRVEGTLYDVNRAPVAGATIRLRAPEIASPMTTTTGEDGQYAFENVKAGIRVEIIALQSGRTVAREFALVTLWVETVDLRPELIAATAGAGDLNPEGGSSAEIRGIVRSADGASIAGATVTINETTVATTTDSAGRYAFSRLRSGLALELAAAANGFKPATAQVIVPGSDHAEADFALDGVRASASAENDRPVDETSADNGSKILRPVDMIGIPTVAQMDLFRGIQFLPGVGAALEGSSDLYVRGGSPDQTLVTLDGFTLYPLRNAFGSLTALNMDAVESAAFSPSAVDAADGDRLGGIVRLKGAANASGKPTGSVGVSMLGLNAVVSAPVGSRASFLVAGRRSPPPTLYDDLLDRTDGSSTAPEHGRVASFSGGTFGMSPPSSFHDLNGKVDVKVASTDRVSVSFYDGAEGANLSRNVLLPATATGDLAGPATSVIASDAIAQVSDVESWKGRGMSARWDRRWSSAATTSVSVGHSEFSRIGDGASVLTSAASGQDLTFAAGRGGSDGLAESNRIEDTTVRLDNTIALGFAHAVSVGGEVVSFDSDYRVQTEVFSHASVAGLYASSLVDLLDRTTTGRWMTAYAQDAWRPLGNLTISPGARLTHYDLASATYLDPRLSASYGIGRRFRVVGDWTIDHQAANRIVREDLTRGDGEFWTLADGSTVPVPRVRQFDVGANIVLPTVAWEAHIYHKDFDDLTMFAPRLFPGVTVSGSGGLFHYGTGRAMGFETMVRYKSDWNIGWTSYTASRAEYTYPSLEAATFPASFDQTQELKVADTMRFGAYSIGAIWVVGSGRPDTPVQTTATQVWYPSGDAVYQVVFGAKNSERLPPYHRLDVSARREIHLGALGVGLSATLFNVYDRQNIAYHDYETAGSVVAVSDVLLMRRTLNLAATVGF